MNIKHILKESNIIFMLATPLQAFAKVNADASYAGITITAISK